VIAVFWDVTLFSCVSKSPAVQRNMIPLMGAAGSSETLNLCQPTRRRILEDSIIVKIDLIVAVPVDALKAYEIVEI
jgi:hypothetical protein